jgi:cytochrome c biogenesis protein ResB
MPEGLIKSFDQNFLKIWLPAGSLIRGFQEIMKKRSMNALLKVVSSSKLALALVLMLILFAAAGAILPQEGMFAPADISRWQDEHPVATSLLKPPGFFRVFHSIPFLVIIFLLAVNTLTCTLLHILKEGGFSAFRGPGAIKRTGFALLHLCLIILFAGGFWSSATKMDGYIVLTEGQGIKEEPGSYVRLIEGPLRREKHRGFFFRLNSVQVEYEKKHYRAAITSHIEIFDKRRKAVEAAIKVNHPFTYRGIDFTQDQTGYSPRLIIRQKSGGRPVVDSFFALKTFHKGKEWEYRDFLPLPFFKQRVIVTFYPTFTRIKGQVQKSGEEPDNPLLLIRTEDETGQAVSKDYLTMNGGVAIEDYTLTFAGIRRWSAFKVIDDPGYPIVMIALWLGILAILLRYIPELRSWFREE